MAVIQVERLSYRYPGGRRLALDAVSARIDRGELVGVVGANGAGKTTLCQALVGLVPHFYRGAVGGQVHVGGVDVHATAVADVAQHVGFVFPNPFTQLSGAKDTVLGELAFGCENLGVPRDVMLRRIAGVVDALGLQGLEERNPLTLSGGQLQRLAIASVLVLQPDVLVLDEPTSQLDPAGTAQVLGIIAELCERGMTVVVAEHDVDWLAARAGRLLALDEGRIVAFDSPARLYDRDLGARGIPEPAVTTAARALGWRRPDGHLPLTVAQARAARDAARG